MSNTSTQFELIHRFAPLQHVGETIHETLRVLRAQSGDRDAMERLLMSIQPSLLRFLRALVGRSGADDALQDTLFQIYRKLEQLYAPELFRPWAFRIARRVGLRQMKRDARWLDGFGDETELNVVLTPEPTPSEESLQQLLDDAEISPASRVVLLLHFQEGMSLPEVSAALELPLGTVKSRLGYGLTALRKRLNPARNE